MPTQEELNAAQVELDIANDNYAALADRYNKYQKLFQEYANASPEIQERAKEAMGYALEDFYQTQEKMYAAEDRIAVAQNTVNSYNELLAQQPVQQPVARNGYNSGRNISPTPAAVEQPVVEQPTVEVTTNGYKVAPYSGSSHSLSARRAAEQPFTLPYQNNTLAGVAGNFAAQSAHDWRQAGQEWNNVVWPRIKNFGNNFLNAEKQLRYDNPNKVANAVNDFVLGTPQRRL